MNQLLFRDATTGEQFFYEELWVCVSAGSIDYAPWVQPDTPGEAVRALLTAVVLRQPLTLFDADFSEEERMKLGGYQSQLEKRIHVVGRAWSNFIEMRKEAHQHSGFSLTLFTSGSTGLAKRVTHDLEGLTRMLKVSAAHADNVWGLAYNSTHIAGVQVILQAFFNKNPLVNLFGASRSSILSAVVDHGITHLSATPSFFRLLLPVTDPLPDVHSVTLGGESSNAELLECLRRAFPQARIHNIYASTEVGSLLVSKGDVFSIPTNLEGSIVIHDGRLWVHRSLVGEGATRSPDGDSAASCDAVRNGETVKRSDGFMNLQSHGLTAVPEGDAWFDTGDTVEVVSEAPLRFRIVARDRDWVNVGGCKVNPQEVEAILTHHPSVQQAKVFGRKNSVMGNLLSAEVVLLEGADDVTEQDLRFFASEHLQPFKIPRIIRFVKGLSTTRSGKILRS